MNGTLSTTQTASAIINSERIDWVRETLIPFFQRLSSLAESARAKLFKLLWLSIASACWLTYFTYWLFGFNAGGLTPVFFAFIVPSLFIWKLSTTLGQVITVPGQLLAMGDNLKQLLAQSKNDTRERISKFNADASSKTKLLEMAGMIRQLFSQGKLLKDLSVEFAKTGKQEVIEAVILVASPQFAILMGIATIGTAISLVFTVVTGVSYLFLY